MKTPTIITVAMPESHIVILDLELLSHSEAFEGHFPNNPILPGVVQIDWAVHFAAVYFAMEKISTRDFQVKFRNIIRPSDPLSLQLEYDVAKGKLSFAYKSGEMLMSSGHFRLGDKT